MPKKVRRPGVFTRAVHAGQMPDPATGAVMTPIYATSTFVQSSPGVHKGFDYARAQNPTRQAFERCIADLEGGTAAFAFASGLAASAAVLELLDHGSHVVAVEDIYGGTYRLFENIRHRSAGLSVSYVDATDAAAIQAAILPTTRMIWIETPSNPLLRLADLAAVAEIGRKNGLISVADNTFASPIIQRPLEYGFDIVVHSATKYLNGHSDIIGGVAVVAGNKVLRDGLTLLQKGVGGILGPFESFLALRGLKTLPLRMARHCDNAMTIAIWLETHPAVARVIYPGLQSHPQYQLACWQMQGFGGIVSVALIGNKETTVRFLERCRTFALAESLGGVESLISHPATMTHASVPQERRAALGITDTLVRLSVGIEDAEDLIADLDQAFAAAGLLSAKARKG
jgi:cystathionine gamma-lyase